MRTVMFLAVTTLAQGASIPVMTMSFSCQTWNPQAQIRILTTGSTGCSATDPVTGVMALASGSAYMDAITEPTLTLSGHVKTDLLATPMQMSAPPTPSGYAEGEIEVSESFYTSGAIRQGLLAFDVINGTGPYVFQYSTGRLYIGDVSFGYGNGGSLPPPVQQYPFAKFPFTLGTAASFTISQYGIAGDWCCSHGSADVTFHLLEADGVTPVMIQPNPEPGTWALMAMGLGALVCDYRRRETNQKLHR